MDSYRLTQKVIDTGADIDFHHINGRATFRNKTTNVTFYGTVEELLEAGWIEVAPSHVVLDKLQTEVYHWANYNFDPVNLSVEDQTALVALTGVAEEAGEVVRAIRKLVQGIRGTREEWIAEIEKEGADVVIQLMSGFNALGLNLNDAVAKRWESVGRRDWKNFPKNGVSE